MELALSRIIGMTKSTVDRQPTTQGKSHQSSVVSPPSSLIRHPSSLSSTNHQLTTTNFSLWGISATIGNLDEAMEVLLTPLKILGEDSAEGVVVRARLAKRIEVESILPDEIEKYPWEAVLLVGGDFLKMKHSWQQFNNATEAGEWLKKNQPAHASLLVKGSRSMQMEKV